MTAFKPLVFSGVQPTGNLHLGNYLGAIRRFAQLQASHDCIYCVVDQHAITTWQDPAELTSATREVTAAFLAAGIDPKKNIVFNQSRVLQHAELAWIFNCVARMGWLERMTQFKEKAGKDRENASVGLFAYPTLDGGRHSRLPRHACAGRRRPEAASGADPRHRPKIQQQLFGAHRRSRGRRRDDGRRGEGQRLLPDHRAADRRAGAARHVAARRLEEDVEIRRFRPVAHQPDRRRRHDRQEDPQGQDRPGAAAVGDRRAQGPAGGAKTWSCSMPRWPRPAARRCSASSAASSSRCSSRRSPIWRSKSSPRSPARCGAFRPIRPMSTACCATAAGAPACLPRRR